MTRGSPIVGSVAADEPLPVKGFGEELVEIE